MFYIMNSAGIHLYKYVAKNQSFIDFKDEVCKSCGRNISVATYGGGDNMELIVEGGKRYPDFLEFCGAGDRMLLLSDRALKIFEQENVSGISVCEPVIIRENVANRGVERQENISQYYKVKLNGSIDFDYSSMFLKRKKYCPECGQYELNRHRLHPYYVDGKSWNGCDLCSLITFPAFVVCTEKVVKIVKANKLTNFAFEEMCRRSF